jgi:signal transduction histidine kinase
MTGQSGTIAALNRNANTVDLLCRYPRGAEWDRQLLHDFITGGNPRVPRDVTLAPIMRRGRAWGAIALSYPDDANPNNLKDVTVIAGILGKKIAEIDHARVLRIKRKIERRIADRNDPKDIIYGILHGIRSLTHYDHSASFWVSHSAHGPLKLVAQQISWTKAKSGRIGRMLDLNESLQLAFGGQGVMRLCRDAGDWRLEDAEESSPWISALDYESVSGTSAPRERGLLLSVITTPDEAFGVLRVSAQHPDAFGEFEAEIIEAFLPLLSLTLQFLLKTDVLQNEIVRAARKHALADLARGIAHDINNALTSIYPLVQQMRADGEQVSPEKLARDLGIIESNIDTCRRIFGSMLALNRDGYQSVGHGNVRRAINLALSVNETGLRRRNIAVTLDIPDELPTVRGTQGALTQLFLNLFGNAKDAMPQGGRLTITACRTDTGLEVTVDDTGIGIPASIINRVTEPVFSTKTDGNGLGLSICRSIMWDVNGQMTISSEEGCGTTVTLSMPCENASIDNSP